ncbi:hypothetical protein DPMN_027484 [Dreissena polymorpha]|uniref:Uncharacterized protein n=1 Tax=Dreissena polymorpha TaxID=45954 RepID=A0A9D4RDH7_DREPO|nr:hypothetical protein DPMN_027484 [Dreissena polymorpha]
MCLLQDVLNTLQSHLECADTPELLVAVVDVILEVTRGFPEVFQYYFRVCRGGLVVRPAMEKWGLMHVRKVLSQISLCRSYRLIRDNPFCIYWIFVLKRPFVT